MRHLTPLFSSALFVSVCILTSGTASAGGLESLLEAAMDHDPAIASANTRVNRGAADVVVARAALLPTVTANGGYTRNQVAAEVELPGEDPIVITPIDQLEVTFRAEVPLWDGTAWAGTRAAAHCRDSAKARTDASVSSALLEVVRAAWDARTAIAAVKASEAAVEANQSLVDRAKSRLAEGTAAQLDVLRATADLEKSKEDLALAQADAAAARRKLASRTGQTALPDDLSPRALPPAAGSAEDVPAVRAARADAACYGAQVDQQKWRYSPTVKAFAQERVTNATGFAGQAGTYALGVQGSWTLLDGGAREGRISQANADRWQAEANLAEALRSAEVALADATDDHAAAASGLTSARARREASGEALRVARERFDAGLGTAVEVTLAVRDERDAAVSLARAESREAVAIESLRVARGQALVGGDR